MFQEIFIKCELGVRMETSTGPSGNRTGCEGKGMLMRKETEKDSDFASHQAASESDSRLLWSGGL